MCGPKFGSMKISQDILRRQGGAGAGGGAGEPGPDEIQAGMDQKSKEFAAAGNRVYLPIAD
jgi:phosphomethylpyrimidine synthase